MRRGRLGVTVTRERYRRGTGAARSTGRVHDPERHGLAPDSATCVRVRLRSNSDSAATAAPSRSGGICCRRRTRPAAAATAGAGQQRGQSSWAARSRPAHPAGHHPEAVPESRTNGTAVRSAGERWFQAAAADRNSATGFQRHVVQLGASRPDRRTRSDAVRAGTGTRRRRSGSRWPARQPGTSGSAAARGSGSRPAGRPAGRMTWSQRTVTTGGETGPSRPCSRWSAVRRVGTQNDTPPSGCTRDTERADTPTIRGRTNDPEIHRGKKE